MQSIYLKSSKIAYIFSIYTFFFDIDMHISN